MHCWFVMWKRIFCSHDRKRACLIFGKASKMWNTWKKLLCLKLKESVAQACTLTSIHLKKRQLCSQPVYHIRSKFPTLKTPGRSSCYTTGSCWIKMAAREHARIARKLEWDSAAVFPGLPITDVRHVTYPCVVSIHRPALRNGIHKNWTSFSLMKTG